MNLFLKPARDVSGTAFVVRDPLTRVPLSEAGEWKHASAFWRRRLRDGDVIEATPARADKASAPAVPGVVSHDETRTSVIPAAEPQRKPRARG